MKLTCAIFLLLLPLCGCGSDGSEKGEDYGNLLASPGGLLVLEEEHPDGWNRADCLLCHAVENIHNVNRTGLPDDVVDLDDVRAIVDTQGESSCSLCHGDNGVQP